MRNYPVERLLRPKVEYHAAMASAACTGLFLLSPHYWMMTKEVAVVSAIITSALTYKYLDDGLKVARYQKSLRSLKKYEIKSSSIPLSKGRCFVGQGFKWEARHTQRLKDVNLPDNEAYKNDGYTYKLARRFEEHFGETFLLKHIAKITSADSFLNPVRPIFDIGGMPAIHGVGVDEEGNVSISLSQRPGHVLVLGTTRVGKTRLEEVIVNGDIRRGGKGKSEDNVVIVIDPKGDADLFRRMYIDACEAGREKDFYFFHLGYTEHSCRYNPIGEFSRITEIAGKTTSQIGGDGDSAAFKAFSWRFVNLIARTLVCMKVRPTFDLIYKYAQDLELLLFDFMKVELTELEDDLDDYLKERSRIVSDKHPLVKKGKSELFVSAISVLNELREDDKLVSQLIHACTLEKQYYDKLVASLLPFLDKLNTDSLATMLSPEYINEDDERPILNWQEVIQRNGIVYIGLDALADREVATAVGNAMLNDLVSTASVLYKNGKNFGLPEIGNAPQKSLQMPEIFLHADEFNSLVGDEFVPLVNQSGGAGIRIAAYTQTLQDLDAKFGSTTGHPKSMQISGNFNTLIMMRVQTEETAKLLVSKVPEVSTLSTTVVSGSSKNQGGELFGFSDTSQDRITTNEGVPMIGVADCQSLPKGHAFVLMDGNKAYKVRLPLFKKDKIKLPNRLEAVCNEMSTNYKTSDLWWTGGSLA